MPFGVCRIEFDGLVGMLEGFFEPALLDQKPGEEVQAFRRGAFGLYHFLNGLNGAVEIVRPFLASSLLHAGIDAQKTK